VSRNPRIGRLGEGGGKKKTTRGRGGGKEKKGEKKKQGGNLHISVFALHPYPPKTEREVGGGKGKKGNAIHTFSIRTREQLEEKKKLRGREKREDSTGRGSAFLYRYRIACERERGSRSLGQTFLTPFRKRRRNREEKGKRKKENTANNLT